MVVDLATVEQLLNAGKNMGINFIDIIKSHKIYHQYPYYIT